MSEEKSVVRLSPSPVLRPRQTRQRGASGLETHQMAVPPSHHTQHLACASTVSQRCTVAPQTLTGPCDVGRTRNPSEEDSEAQGGEATCPESCSGNGWSRVRFRAGLISKSVSLHDPTLALGEQGLWEQARWKGPLQPGEHVLFVSYPAFCQGPWHEHLTSHVNSAGREP